MEHIDREVRAKMRPGYYEIPFLSITNDVRLGEGVVLSQFLNLWGCEIGDYTTVGAFTEIGRGVTIGKRCKIAARVFIPPGITIEDEVFVGPGTVFTNDKYPRAIETRPESEWCLKTVVRRGAAIGAGCVILPGLELGEGCAIGAGTVVTRNIMAGEVFFVKREEYSHIPLDNFLR